MDALKNMVVQEIMHGMNIHSYKGRCVQIVNRKWYGLSFCEKGQISYTHQGKTVVSDPNHAVFLPKGQSYTLYCDKEGHFPVINFMAQDFVCDAPVAISIKTVEPYLRDFEKLQALFVFEDTRHERMSLFYHILYRLFGTDGKKGLLDPAMAYIEKHFYDSTLSNETLAETCNISEVYFRKLFVKQYQTTPKQFVLELRISKAKQLLSEGREKVGAVAEQCGFTNPYHFCRVFKQKEGITPTEYKKQQVFHL